jgi:hypothetical protein
MSVSTTWCVDSKVYSVTWKNEIMSLAGKWMELEIIMLIEINQTEKDKDVVFSLMWNLDFF